MTTELARGLRDEFSSIAEVLGKGDDARLHEAVARAAVRAVPGCDHAAVSLLRNGKFETAAASDDIARRLDALQAQTGDGPCLDVATGPAWEHHLDLESVSDPTEFQHRLREETPIRAVIAYRLVADGQKSGALNLAADSPHAFDDGSAEQAAVLAAFATVAVTASTANRRQRELQQALDTSREIGVAVGIIAASYGMPADEAFQVLVRASQELNRKLRDIAHEVAASTRTPAATRPTSDR